MFVHLISIRPRPHNRSRIFSLHPLLSFVRTFVYLDLSLFGLPYPSILYIGHMILSLSPRVRSKIHTPLISIKIQPSLLSTALGIALRAPAIYDVSCESGISEGGGSEDDRRSTLLAFGFFRPILLDPTRTRPAWKIPPSQGEEELIARWCGNRGCCLRVEDLRTRMTKMAKKQEKPEKRCVGSMRGGS